MPVSSEFTTGLHAFAISVQTMRLLKHWWTSNQGCGKGYYKTTTSSYSPISVWFMFTFPAYQQPQDRKGKPSLILFFPQKENPQKGPVTLGLLVTEQRGAPDEPCLCISGVDSYMPLGLFHLQEDMFSCDCAWWNYYYEQKQILTQRHIGADSITNCC